MGRVAIDQDTLLGGLFLSAILFAVLWFFFGITWWVIAAPVVLMTLVVLGWVFSVTEALSCMAAALMGIYLK